VPLSFTSGAQNSLTTDGVTVAGYGGFNMRGYSTTALGAHTIIATFTDSTGTLTVTSKVHIIEIIPAKGNPFARDFRPVEPHPIKKLIIRLGDGMGVAHRTAARLVR